MGEFADKFAAQKPSRQRAYLGSLLPNYVKSGHLEKYYQKLTDFNFMMAKIQHPEFGLQALIDDYDLTNNLEELSHLEYNHEKVKVLNLIQAVLLMSFDVLYQDNTRLADQLWGRLVQFKTPEIQAILEAVKHSQAIPWLRPLTPCFTTPHRGVLRTLKGHSNWIKAVAVTADGKRAISASRDDTLKVWDLITGKELFSLQGHRESVNAVAIATDGKRAISGSWDNTLKVWDLTTRKEQFTLKGHSNTVQAIAVTADGKRVISGSSDRTIKVWDLTTGDEQLPLKGHKDSVNAVAITPDGKRMIFGSYDTLKVWNLATGNIIASFTGESPIASCAIAPDGLTIVAGDRLGRIYFLRLEGMEALT
jgi:WD40 repeat protein